MLISKSLKAPLDLETYSAMVTAHLMLDQMFYYHKDREPKNLNVTHFQFQLGLKCASPFSTRLLHEDESM